MRRSYQRTVSTTAEPSRANWDSDQPRDCKRCGERLRITRDNVIMRRYPIKESFHAACFPLRRIYI